MPGAPGLPSFASTPSLHERFESQVDRTPDAIAVALGSERITYRELDRRANRLAHRLRRAGVVPDTLVALAVERSIDMVVGILGILKAGGAYVPLDSAYPRDRLEFMLVDSGSKLLVTHDGASPPDAGAGVQVVRIESTAGEPDTRVAAGVDPDHAGHAAYVIYTSGSTGRPKGVIVTHGNVVRLFTATDAWYGFGPDDVWTLFHSYAFDFSVWELWGALLYGGKLVVVPYLVSRSPESFFQLLVAEGVTVLNQTPSAFRQLQHVALASPASQALALRFVIFGGEALELQGLRPWFERYGDRQPRLVNMYGITETTVHVTYRPIGWEDLRANLGSVIGEPIPDLGVHLFDDKLQPVPDGTPGEICVEGAGLARGYLNRPELTAERFIHLHTDALGRGHPVRLYRSGDQARRLPNGDLEYLGRIDMQVKIRGFRIELGEIETVIASHPAVREVVVIAREDTPGDKRLVAYLSSTDTAPEGLIEALRERLRERVPAYMVPAAFVRLPRLPLTENGKVDRRALPAPDASRPALETEFVEPEGQTEIAIAAIWRRLLRLDRIGANDSFFDLGGSSLLAVESLSVLRNELGRTVPVVALFRHPTVRGLAGELAGGGDGALALADVRDRAERQKQVRRDAVAIIGMAGRFPGARNVGELWANLCAGVEGVRFFEEGELDPRVVRPRSPAEHYVRARGVLDHADKFDAAFFGESPALAELMDPQQRVLLEVAWAAFEDAGVVPGKHGTTIGVFAGTGHNTYWLKNVVNRPDRIEALSELQMIISNDKDFVATRIAHKLNLLGPAISVHTACSTSLVATSLAFRSLIDHECDIALAGGASITVPQNAGHVYSEGAMQSADGHTRPFDALATGTVFSDGAGAVVLKRLADARRDGDRIYAVIRGAAINNDGAAKASYTAPSVAGQAAVIAMAHAVADVDPATISYVEAHGTATPLGDPVEVAALTQAFRARTAATGFCAIGSIKSNLGHMTATSGVAGLIKTALALRERKLPPTLFFETPNPHIDFAATPFFVQDKLTDWKAQQGQGRDQPLRAGVSSFGVGGTNAHVIVEAAPPPVAAGPRRDAEVLLLSAKSAPALANAAAELGAFLEANPGVDLADVGYTLQTRRAHFAHRRIVVAATAANAAAALRAAPEAGLTSRIDKRDPGVGFVFPGQGTQYVGMGSSLYAREPAFKTAFDRCADAVRPFLPRDPPRDLREVCFATAEGEEAAAVLRQTGYTQPALFALGYALGATWMSWGVEPTVMVGHSVGEFVAATLAGVFSVEDGAALVAQRGQLMQALPPGAMLSVRQAAAAIEPRLPPGLALAASNGPELCVVSGPAAAIDDFEAALTRDGIACKKLFTSHAFHSAMMDPVVAPFTDIVAAVKRAPPRIPIVSTATGGLLGDDEAIDPGYWARHLRLPVRFMEALRVAGVDPGRVLLEVGPRGTSTTLARQILKTPNRDARATTVASLDDNPGAEVGAVLRALGRLWLAGVTPDFEAFQSFGRRHVVSLPSYPFARDRHWLEPGVPAAAAQPPVAAGGTLEQTILDQLSAMGGQLRRLARSE
jgi:amino acid adenylation domain-containing protein